MWEFLEYNLFASLVLTTETFRSSRELPETDSSPREVKRSHLEPSFEPVVVFWDTAEQEEEEEENCWGSCSVAEPFQGRTKAWLGSTRSWSNFELVKSRADQKFYPLSGGQRHSKTIQSVAIDLAKNSSNYLELSISFYLIRFEDKSNSWFAFLLNKPRLFFYAVRTMVYANQATCSYYSYTGDCNVKIS